MSSFADQNNGYLYVNSFAKKSGSDYSFAMDIPQLQASQISLVSASIDIWLPNLYDTTGKSFSNFGLAISGVIYKCDVFISSLAEFVLWFNAQSPRYKLQLQATPSYQKVFIFRVQDSQNANVFVNSALIGDGWQKLGLTDYQAKATHTGVRLADLSLPPNLLIRIVNPPLKNNIQSNIGTAHFTIPNNANFGGKLLYINDSSAEQRNTIFLDTTVTIQHLEIQMLNCDFAPLYSCDFGNGRDNNDAEVVLVFAIKK